MPTQMEEGLVARGLGSPSREEWVPGSGVCFPAVSLPLGPPSAPGLSWGLELLRSWARLQKVGFPCGTQTRDYGFVALPTGQPPPLTSGQSQVSPYRKGDKGPRQTQGLLGHHVALGPSEFLSLSQHCRQPFPCAHPPS